jgi:hypothetical protein
MNIIACNRPEISQPLTEEWPFGMDGVGVPAQHLADLIQDLGS